MTDAPLTRQRIRLGMVGGGSDAFIGQVHRIAARLDNRYELVAGALSSTPERARASGQALGLSADRTYDDYRMMAETEAQRPDGIDVVAIVTPNHFHFDPCKQFLERGVHVICDKPVTRTLKEAHALAEILAQNRQRFLLTHNYSAYPMVREARRRIMAGELGAIRIVNVEYIQDWLAAGNSGKQAEWRLDPARAGVGGCIGDIGTHAFQLATFVTGLRTEAVSAELHRFGPGRSLDDNAHIKLRFAEGARGMIWVSQVAIGNENGVKLRVIGDRGGLEFFQEDPDKLWVTCLDQPKTLITRGGPGHAGQSRIPAGHPEGFLEAFATLYSDFADLILGKHSSDDPLPGIQDGLMGLRFVAACVASSNADGLWKSLDLE